MPKIEVYKPNKGRKDNKIKEFFKRWLDSVWGDKIRIMIIVWRMWRMVRKLRRLQQIHIKREREGIANIDTRNATIFDKGDSYVARDNLYIKKIDESAIMGSIENFRKLEREFDVNDEVIESCISRGFIKTITEHPTDNQEKRMVALTGEGIIFMDPFFFLKYLIKELGIVWAFLGSVLTAIGIREFIAVIPNILPKIIESVEWWIKRII